jgi:hypothetical protein
VTGHDSLRRDLAGQFENANAPLLMRELFDTTNDAARAILNLADQCCGTVTAVEFVRAGSGLVVGLRSPVERVVIKVHRPHLAAHTGAARRAHRRLFDDQLPVPAPLHREPIPLGHGVVTIDGWRSTGDTVDVRLKPRRRAITQMAHAISAALAPDEFADLAPTWTGRYMPPHSPIFDFEATADGAAWIDALADEARSRRSRAQEGGVGQAVVMHSDLRPENALLTERHGAAEVSTIYDLDSLEHGLEPWLIGGVARAFSTNWSRPDPMLPTVDEIGLFIADYECARGTTFTADESSLARAGVTYALAYSARCEHALFPDGTEAPWGPGWRQLLRNWTATQRP